MSADKQSIGIAGPILQMILIDFPQQQLPGLFMLPRGPLLIAPAYQPARLLQPQQFLIQVRYPPAARYSYGRFADIYPGHILQSWQFCFAAIYIASMAPIHRLHGIGKVFVIIEGAVPPPLIGEIGIGPRHRVPSVYHRQLRAIRQIGIGFAMIRQARPERPEYGASGCHDINARYHLLKDTIIIAVQAEIARKRKIIPLIGPTALSERPSNPACLSAPRLPQPDGPS